MAPTPRLALATATLGPDPAPGILAVLAAMAEGDRRVQHYRSRACPAASGLIGAVTGLPGRHLDAWLMPAETLRTVFARGRRHADLAVVEGPLAIEPAGPDEPIRPGDLGPIAEALDLPVVALVPCAALRGLHLPRLPRSVEGVILDGLERREDFPELKAAAELILRRPVVGAIEALPAARAAIAEAERDPAGASAEAMASVARLAQGFLRTADLAALRALAGSRPAPGPALDEPGPRRGRFRPFRVAFAQDDAFGGYFPDTLETLEALGAELLEFSPLADEALPEAADLVIVGCGRPDRFAVELSNNLSLVTALRAHVCRGGRIYAEGGGTAYLGRSMDLGGGRLVAGAGIFPFDALLRPEPGPPSPVTRVLRSDTWLGPAGTLVRGYRSGRWDLAPAPEPGDCPLRSGALTAERDAYFRRQAIGGLMHLHLAALPEVVAAFAGMRTPAAPLSARR